MLIVGWIYCSAQSVLGIPFGSSYDETFSRLVNRYGYSTVHNDSGTIELDNFLMGGFEFHIGTLSFQFDQNRSYLNAASFQRWYELSDVARAKSDRDFLYSLLKDKYDGDAKEFTNEDGFKCYKFGTDPKDPSKWFGVIYLCKGKGKDSKERYYLFLDYGPIYYLDKGSDF